MTVFLSCIKLVYAQTPPASETAGGLLQQQKTIDSRDYIDRRSKSDASVDRKTSSVESADINSSDKVHVASIKIDGNTLLATETIVKITSRFEGRDLTFKEIQSIADLLTDEYRARGYVTSRAYIPPQSMNDGVLTVKVVEGKMGDVEFRGNRYFKSGLLGKMVELRPRGYFDFQTFQRSLAYINEHPDRQAKAVLVPGKAPGTNDIIIDVKDRLPVHVGGTYDNYASRYLGEKRWTAFVEHNNLSGMDDKLRLEYQQSRDASLKVTQGRYVFPVKRGFDVGMYFQDNESELGREFKSLESKGSAFVLGVFANQLLVKSDSLDLRLNMGFDHKTAKNDLIGIELSQDDTRLLKAGVDIDANDAWGRNIIITEYDLGLADFMGSMSARDPHSSRGSVGSGGQFDKVTLNYFRLQPAPWATEFLWKNSGQFSGSNLVAGEQFQMGGPGSVRGYAPGEFAGDRGFYSGLEWTVPPYFVPRDWRIPTTDQMVVNAVRFVTFFDWATTRINTPLTDESKARTLSGCGYGVRLNITDFISARFEIGYHLRDYDPSNGKNAQPWFDVTVRF